MGPVNKIWDRVKIIHAGDLETWTLFRNYYDHDGLTLGEYRVQREAAEAVLQELDYLVRAQSALDELRRYVGRIRAP
jgi:hypothetical protein